MRIKEEDFMLININCLKGEREMGVLKTIGERKFVVSAKLLDEAKEEDNLWLMEQAKELYKQYYQKVQGYKKENSRA